MEIKHVKGYLGYRVEMMYPKSKGLTVFRAVDVEEVVEGYFKLCLRPLSDLTKEIEHNGEKFVPDDELGTIVNIQHQLQKIDEKLMRIDELEYNVVQRLYEWHFDVHNLIEQGKAINLNDLK